MKNLYRTSMKFVRIYTPFVCSLAALFQCLLFLSGNTETSVVYFMANITGGSILLDTYIIATSKRMCIWYKLSVYCLMCIHLLGLLYNQFNVDWTLYVWALVALSLIGVLFFMVFVWTLNAVN